MSFWWLGSKHFSSLSFATFMDHRALKTFVVTRLLRLHRLVQLFVIVVHRLPVPSFNSLVNGLTRGIPSTLTVGSSQRSASTLGSTKLRCAPVSSALTVISSPPRMTASGKISSNLWLDHLDRCHAFAQAVHIHCFVIVHFDELPVSVHSSLATLFP